MNTAFLIWLYVFIGNLHWLVPFCWVVFCTCAAAVFLSFMATEGEVMEDRPQDWDAKIFRLAVKHAKRFLVAAIFMTVLFSMYPDRKDLVLIIGGTAVFDMAQSDQAKQLPDKVLRAANAFLDGIEEKPKETQ